jgi:beta-lactamase class A
MIRSLDALLLGSALSAASREQLARWMLVTKTGAQRLRAGAPSSWRIGDKTGTGERGTTNDVGILWPPSRKPRLIAVYITDTRASVAASSEVIASVARLATAPPSATRENQSASKLVSGRRPSHERADDQRDRAGAQPRLVERLANGSPPSRPES